MLCPICKRTLRAGKGTDVTKDGKEYRVILLYCKTRGCPNNNGEPLYKDEVKK